MAFESLEHRVVPTAAAAAVDIQYLRAITHLNTLMQSRVNQIQTMLTRRVARADARFEAALGRTAARLGGGPPAVAQQAQTELSRATGTTDGRLSRVARQADGQIRRFTAGFNRQIAGVLGRFDRANRSVRAANPYFAAQFHNALAAIDAGIPAEGQAAQETVRAAAAPVQSAVTQAATPEAQATVEAAADRVADTSGAQLAGEKAAVRLFWERYYSSFNPLRAEMAAIASAQLPPVHLGPGTVTGPLGKSGGRRGINGTGASTVPFTGILGIAGTINGTTGTGTTGFGTTGVGTTGFGTTGLGTTGLGTTGLGTTSTGTTGLGTTGTGAGLGAGTGSGTNSTGGGTNGTAGNGANGNGIGASTGAAGSPAGGTLASPPMV